MSQSDFFADTHRLNAAGFDLPKSTFGTYRAVLEAGGWTLDSLTPEQSRVLTGLISERNLLLETISLLNKQIEEAYAIADHDPLLPVYNRRAFMRELSRQLSFCYRYNSSACLIYLDLDRFKQVNDTYGHAAGDEALKGFTHILKTHTRESDLLGRMGGDEFALLLINASAEDAHSKADQFIADMDQIQNWPGPLRLGLSCGVVEWKRGEKAEALIDRADEAMYVEKLRNRAA